MADALTTFLSLIKPEVNVSTTWPTSWNANADTIDDNFARPKQAFNAPTVGATTTCDLSLARRFRFTVSQATTLAFTNVPSSSFWVEVELEITNGAAFVLTFPAAVTWLNGLFPTFQAAGVDRVRLFTRDGGTTLYALHTGKNLTLTGTVIVGKFYSSIGGSAIQARPTDMSLASAAPGIVATVEASLVSTSLAASSLINVGDAVRIKLIGRALAQAAQVRVKFGATYVLNAAGGNNITSGNVFSAEVVIRRITNTTQVAVATVMNGATPIAAERTTPGETLTGGLTLDVRGNTAAGGGTLDIDSATFEVLAN